MPIQSANPPEIFTLEQFAGINQENERATIHDQELVWCENLFPIAAGNLRSMWGPSAPLWQAPAGTKILRIFFGFYGNDVGLFSQPPPGRKGWMCLDDGTIWEVDLDDQSRNKQVGDKPIWEPIPPKYWISIKVWRPRYVGHALGEIGGIVIGSPLGLYAWDGQVLYSPGDLAPYWLSNDDVTMPATPTIMPVGLVNIYAMEVYQERLWLAGRTVIQFSAPTNGADFAASDGGGSFGYFGDKLVHDFMDLAASSGYLFVFGDSSTDVIANVQLVGAGTETNPFITNFNYSNVDPITGQRFPRPVGHWGRYFLLFNGAGLWEMQGGDAQSRGEKVLNIWNTVEYPASAADTDKFYPTMCPATMFGKRVMLVNGQFTDIWGIKRSMLLVWDGLKWWTASQYYDFAGTGVESTYLNITNIASYEDNSVITPYGTDGTYLFRLFDHPDPLLPKRLLTKAYRGTGQAMVTIKNFSRLYMEFYDNSGEGWTRTDSQTVSPLGAIPTGVEFTGVARTTGGGIPNGSQDVSFSIPGGLPRSGLRTQQPKTYSIEPWPLNGAGIAIELDLESKSPDFTIERIHFAGEQRTRFGA